MVEGKVGQLKIQQMAFVLLAMTLFFALAGMFALVFLMAGLREGATTLEEKNALLLVTKLANSPEFSCGGAYDSDRTNCVDFDKVMVLSRNIDKYSKFWGVQNIEIRKVYPAGPEVICDFSNYPDCNSVKIKTDESGEISGYYLENFVTLCSRANKDGLTYSDCNIAKLLVSYNQK